VAATYRSDAASLAQGIAGRVERMNEDDVRARAESVGASLIAGDVDGVIGQLSEELRRNPGEVVAMLPLPATEVNVESVERTASGYAVVLELVGETDQVRVQTRWKDRNDEPTIVEVSHLSRTAREAELAAEGEASGEGTEASGEVDATRT
jgi:hypothetical protein